MGKSVGLWKRDSYFFSRFIKCWGGGGGRGMVLIAFRESLDYKILSGTHDSNGRLIIINTIIKGSAFILIDYYAPNDENGQI